LVSLHQCSVCGEHHDIVPQALIDKPGVEHWRTVVEVHQHSVLAVHNHTAHEAHPHTECWEHLHTSLWSRVDISAWEQLYKLVSEHTDNVPLAQSRTPSWPPASAPAGSVAWAR